MAAQAARPEPDGLGGGSCVITADALMIECLSEKMSLHVSKPFAIVSTLDTQYWNTVFVGNVRLPEMT